jgi:hypothetical protein
MVAGSLICRELSSDEIQFVIGIWLCPISLIVQLFFNETKSINHVGRFGHVTLIVRIQSLAMKNGVGIYPEINLGRRIHL